MIFAFPMEALIVFDCVILAPTGLALAHFYVQDAAWAGSLSSISSGMAILGLLVAFHRPHRKAPVGEADAQP
jgi:hypothetical protein